MTTLTGDAEVFGLGYDDEVLTPEFGRMQSYLAARLYPERAVPRLQGGP